MTKGLFIVLFLSLGLVSGAIAAGENPGNGNHCPHHRQASRLEDIILMVPSTNSRDCSRSLETVRESITRFYRWYLETAPRMKQYSDLQKQSIDLIPPFNINWHLVQEYADYIRKNYPLIDTLEVPGQADSQGMPAAPAQEGSRPSRPVRGVSASTGPAR